MARPQAAPETYPILRSSTVPKPEVLGGEQVVLDESEPPSERRQPSQTSLAFESEGPRVIPFQLPAAKRTKSPRRRGVTDGFGTRRARIPGGTNLELGLREPGTKDSGEGAPRSFLYGYARAASPMHRSLAAVLDASMILIATGLFFLTFYLGGGALAFNKITTPCYVAVPVLIALFYEAVCALGGGITVGMRWTRLRLLNFDGRKPNTEECLLRVLGTVVSVASAGLGYLWALFDEENLAWPDHISKTFPTPSQIRQPY
ncbi:MAG: RDD family protein [Acidobacteriales bacterium]|nr:RDD family protein [Terriglobales bacterium]